MIGPMDVSAPLQSPATSATDCETAGEAATAHDSRAAGLIRDVILGGQDGLVNVLGLVLGMAVATGSSHLVITAGLAALLAESIAMAGVAFTATGAERQLGSTLRRTLEARRDLRSERRRSDRLDRLADLALAQSAIELIVAEVDTEAVAWREELDVARAALAPVRETRPIRAAIVVGVSTMHGSAVPLIPFLVFPISSAPVVALAAAAIVLALAGIERARTTGGRPGRAALEMVGIGLVSALAGYLIGQLLGGRGS